MATFYTKEADLVQWDPVDDTFALPILAQLGAYLEEYAWVFPDERLYRRFVEAIKGLIAARVPIVAQMAAAVIQSHDPQRTFHVAKRYYRWLDNPRLEHRSLLKPAYARTRQLFADQTGEYVLVIMVAPPKICLLHPFFVKGAFLLSDANLPEHPLHGMIRSELVKGGV